MPDTLTPHVVIVPGTRKPPDNAEEAVERRLKALHESLGKRPLVVITGGALGIDSLADEWARRAKRNGAMVFPRVVHAEWDLFKLLGCTSKAGPFRNEDMVLAALHYKRETNATLSCFAFPTADSRGTWDCVKRCKLAGIDVEVCRL